MHPSRGGGSPAGGGRSARSVRDSAPWSQAGRDGHCGPPVQGLYSPGPGPGGSALRAAGPAGSNGGTEMNDVVTGAVNAVRHSRLLRVLLIGFLVLLLQIPIAMIEGQIGDRTTTRGQAVEDVTGKWG